MESFGFVFVAAICLFVSLESCQAASSWSYSGANDGVEQWATNFPGQCDGKSQSPIDLEASSVRFDDSLQAFEFDGFDTDQGINWTLLNNGHTVQVNYVSGNPEVKKGSLEGTFRVAQFHFHWGGDSTKGSEHTVDGNQYPMEVHIVCYRNTYSDLTEAVGHPDGLAVLGFFFEIAPSTNPIMQRLVDRLPSVMYPQNQTSMVPFALDNLMAGVSDFYRYSGGLTTPTCNEVVTWTVFKNTIKISEAQMRAFRSLKDAHGHNMVNNYRPVQQLHSRSILANFYNAQFAGSAAGLVVNGFALLSSLALALWVRL